MEGEEDWKYNDTRCVERLIFFNSRILKGFVSNGGGRESIGGWRTGGSKGGSSGTVFFTRSRNGITEWERNARVYPCVGGYRGIRPDVFGTRFRGSFSRFS